MHRLNYNTIIVNLNHKKYTCVTTEYYSSII